MQSTKKLLQVALLALMLVGFVIVPAGFGFWMQAYPDRSIGIPLFLVFVNLFVCVWTIYRIADYWNALTKLERQDKEKGE